MSEFTFSEVQAQAILDMRLARLAALERKKIEDELKEVLKEIKYLEGLLADPKKILGLIRTTWRGSRRSTATSAEPASRTSPANSPKRT